MIHNFPSRVQGSRCGGLPVSLEAILPAGEPKGVQHSGAFQRAHKLARLPCDQLTEAPRVASQLSLPAQ